MVDTVVPPPGEIMSAAQPDVQHALGLFYLDEGASQTVIEVIGGTDVDPKFYVLGQDRLYNFSDFPAKCRILGPVVMPLPPSEDNPEVERPGAAMSRLLHSAYQSGFSAGVTDLPPKLRVTVERHHYDGAADALLRMVAAGRVPRTQREEDVYEVVDELVEQVLEVGSRGMSWDLRRADADELRDAAMYKIRDVVDKANPHHPDATKRTFGAEDYESWVGENDRLRSVVLWAAQQIPDKAKLRELAAKIRAASVQDQAEEDELQVLDFREKVDKVCELVEAAMDCRLPEADMSRYPDSRGSLPLYWNGKAENAVQKLRSAMEDLPEVRTLARVRFA